jgi:queuosine precursor transporter
MCSRDARCELTIDSATFVVVAFSGRMSPRQMVLVAFTGWAIMVVWEIAALPLTLPLVRALKRQGVDYFDIGHEFQPAAIFEAESVIVHL